MPRPSGNVIILTTLSYPLLIFIHTGFYNMEIYMFFVFDNCHLMNRIVFLKIMLVILYLR